MQNQHFILPKQHRSHNKPGGGSIIIWVCLSCSWKSCLRWEGVMFQIPVCIDPNPSGFCKKTDFLFQHDMDPFKSTKEGFSSEKFRFLNGLNLGEYLRGDLKRSVCRWPRNLTDYENVWVCKYYQFKIHHGHRLLPKKTKSCNIIKGCFFCVCDPNSV